jgi:hypothetical protein
MTLADISDALERSALETDIGPGREATQAEWTAWRVERAEHYERQAALWGAVQRAPDLSAVPSAARWLLVFAAGGHAYDARTTAGNLRPDDD